MIRALLLVVLAFAIPAFAADDDVARVKAQLLQPEVLRGHFAQSKQIQGFSKPLQSSGDFIVAREEGILWRTLKPFPGVLKLTRDEIVATQGDAVAFRLNASSEPSVRIINGLMFALLNGDVAALDRQFTIVGGTAGDQWTLALTPKQAAFAKLIRSIELRGDRHVHTIAIAEANGDDTRIVFSEQSSDPAQLSAEERQRFR